MMTLRLLSKVDDRDKHDEDVNSLVFANGKLYSGANDGKIKVWKTDLDIASEFQAHYAPVFSLAASSNTVYSCSSDGTVKAWDLATNNGATIVKCQDEFWKVCYSDDLLYVGNNQGLLSIYRGKKLIGSDHMCDPIKDLAVCDKRVFTVRDLDLVVTDFHETNDNKLKPVNLHTIVGKSPVITYRNKIIFVSRSGKDILVHENSKDVQFKMVTQEKDAHKMIINALLGLEFQTDKLLLSAGWDRVVKLWKLEDTGLQLLHQIDVQMVVETMTTGEDGDIYVGGSEGQIIRLDIF